MIFKKAIPRFDFKQQVFMYLLSAILFFCFGYVFQRYGLMGNYIIPYFKKETKKIKNQFAPYSGHILKIDIPFKDKKKLDEERNEALDIGIMQNFNYVNCKLSFEDKTYPAAIRLKGDMSDHLEGEKWSFRVKLKNDNAILGLKRFSLQHPSRRGYLKEWFFHTTLKRENLINLRYFFVKIILNGKDLGIYALEEHFDQILIENNRRRDGAILRFDEKWDWISAHQFQKFPELWEYRSGYGDYNGLPVTSFNINQMSKENNQIQNFFDGKNLLEQFLEDKIATSQAFDVDKIARFFAIVDLLGARHSVLIQNLRLYYNSINQKLEPIGFDGDLNPMALSLSFMMREDHNQQKYYINLFKDLNFFEKYLEMLNYYLNANLVETIFKENKEKISQLEKIINYEWPDRKFNIKSFNVRKNYINEILNPYKLIDADLIKANNDSVVIEVGNIQKLPLANFELLLGDTLKIKPKKDITIGGRLSKELTKRKELIFTYQNSPLPNLSSLKNTIQLSFNILGLEKMFTSKVDTIFNNLLPSEQIAKSTLTDYDFLIVDNEEKQIFFKKRNISIESDLLFPPDYKIYIKDSTTINLKKSSEIYSESPFICVGNEKNPIVFTSSDSSSNGLLIYNTPLQSYFEYCYFSNFGSFDSSTKTGALTAYETYITITNSKFNENYTEDALNCIRSQVKLNNISFLESKSDAVDLDFCIGEIIDLKIKYSGNDGLDFSGSNLTIKSIYITNAGDKGISIGEKSIINGSEIKVTKSKIGIVSKDKSSATFNNVILKNMGTGFAAYQKKQEFGNAELHINDFSFSQTDSLYILEEGSRLILNASEMNFNSYDAIESLYEQKMEIGPS